MSLWKIRQQGSSMLSELSLEELVEGIEEGIWEPVDEVQGPNDRNFRTLESHPQFAEAMADVDVFRPTAPPEDARLDMNPLIDVALVLLIFFILTTTYEELRKEFPAPPATPEEEKTMGKMTVGELKKMAIAVTARTEKGEVVVRVNNDVVPEGDLQPAIERAMGRTGFKKLAVDVQPDIPWRVFMAIQDAAAGAKIEETIRVTRRASNDEK